jgi:hypothetical protein
MVVWSQIVPVFYRNFSVGQTSHFFSPKAVSGLIPGVSLFASFVKHP